MTYSDKLKDPRWQKKRLEMLDGNNWTCEKCLATEETLHVHHMAYTPGRDPWSYSRDMLAVLCDKCHAKEHSYQDEIDKKLVHAARSMFLGDDIETITEAILSTPIITSRSHTASIVNFALTDLVVMQLLRDIHFCHNRNNK